MYIYIYIPQKKVKQGLKKKSLVVLVHGWVTGKDFDKGHIFKIFKLFKIFQRKSPNRAATNDTKSSSYYNYISPRVPV